MNQKLKENIVHSPVVVHTGRFAYIKSDLIPKDNHYFMVTKDQDEVTIIIEEQHYKQNPHHIMDETKWFKLVEIKTLSPFVVPGFIAAITRVIAERGLTVLVVSTYSKDYVFLHEQDLDIGLDALRLLGFHITS